MRAGVINAKDSGIEQTEIFIYYSGLFLTVLIYIVCINLVCNII